MANPVPITKSVALAAVQADEREGPFHSLAGRGFILGADTSRESVVEAISSSDDSDPDHPQIAWTRDPVRPGHELVVVDGHDAVRWYDLVAPPGTFDDDPAPEVLGTLPALTITELETLDWALDVAFDLCDDVTPERHSIGLSLRTAIAETVTAARR